MSKKKSKKKSDGSIRKSSPPYSEENIDYNDLCPIFSLRYMREKYSLKRCTPEQKQAFADRMVELSQLTWDKIIVARRHGLGCEKIPHYSIKGDSIPSCIDPNVTLLALRFSNKHPMVGYREKDIFHILWFDFNFTLYDHGS